MWWKCEKIKNISITFSSHSYDNLIVINLGKVIFAAEVMSNILYHIVIKKWWKHDEFKFVLIFWPIMCKHQFEIFRHEVLLSDIEGDSESDVFSYSLFRLINPLSPCLLTRMNKCFCTPNSKTARFRDRFNPFRKKSGLLNVLAKQSTRNRIGTVQYNRVALNAQSQYGTLRL